MALGSVAYDMRNVALEVSDVFALIANWTVLTDNSNLRNVSNSHKMALSVDEFSPMLRLWVHQSTESREACSLKNQ